MLQFIRGFLMGSADVVPGVSGGTVALIVGIYPRLIANIRTGASALSALVRLRLGLGLERLRAIEWGFLLPLLAGIAAALISLARVIEHLLEDYPVEMSALFFGLVFASIFVAGRMVAAWNRRLVATFIGVAILAFLLLGLRSGEAESPATWIFFAAGGVAICAMILPGISGSFILLILQKYAYIFDAIGRLDLVVLLPFALGAGTGLLLFSRVLAFVLRRFYRLTVNVIVGLLIGSLWVIWPFQIRVEVMVDGTTRLLRNTPYLPHSLSGDIIWSIVIAVIGIAAVLALHRAAAARGLPDHV